MSNRPAVGDPVIVPPPVVHNINNSLITGDVLLHLTLSTASSDAAISPHGGDLPEAQRERSPETQFTPHGGEGMADVLGGRAVAQKIPHALDVRTDSDAVSNYSDARLAEMCVPADAGGGGLGVFNRLRVAQVVNETIAAKFSAPGALPDLAALIADADREVERLKKRRDDVRKALQEQLAGEIDQTEQVVADLKANNVSEAVLTSDPGRRRLYDLKYHHGRLTRLVQPPAAVPTPLALPATPTEGSTR